MIFLYFHNSYNSNTIDISITCSLSFRVLSNFLALSSDFLFHNSPSQRTISSKSISARTHWRLINSNVRHRLIRRGSRFSRVSTTPNFWTSFVFSRYARHLLSSAVSAIFIIIIIVSVTAAATGFN